MIAAVVTVSLTLLLIVALNWQRFREMGSGQVLKLGLIWAAIFLGGVALVKLLGIA